MLGFDLLLPTGSTIQMAAGDMLLVAATPYTFDEEDGMAVVQFAATPSEPL